MHQYGFALVIGSSLVCALPATADEYRLTLIAESVGSLAGYTFSHPMIDDAGFVVFRAVPPNKPGEVYLYRGDGEKSAAIVADTLGLVAFIIGIPNLSDNGVTAFAEAYTTGEQLILKRQPDGPLKTIYDPSSGFTCFGSPDINNHGEMVFFACRPGQTGIWSGNGETAAPIALLSGGPHGFFVLSQPSINNNGIAAFFAMFTSGASAIYRGNGPPYSVIIHTSMGYETVGVHHAMNDVGVVAVIATKSSGESFIYTGTGGPLTTIATNNGELHFFDSVTINNHGLVVFSAITDDGRTGIFRGPDPSRDLIIATGDSVNGATIIGLEFLHTSLNQHDEIAFAATLEDGRSVVYRASPANSCPADLNNDSSVNAADLGVLLGSWGACPGCPADLNTDGNVGPADLALLLGAWGTCR